MLYWLENFHVDGIRMDGVSSMLYLNFGIDDPGQKKFNKYGTEEDLDASAFIRQVNCAVEAHYPDVMMMAEESTAWPLVTYPPQDGGLGFHYKWDMGWMNDTLHYMQTDFPWRPATTGCSRLPLCMPYRRLICHSATTRSCTASARSSAACRATGGASLPACARWPSTR